MEEGSCVRVGDGVTVEVLCTVDVTETGSGVASPVFSVRVGREVGDGTSLGITVAVGASVFTRIGVDVSIGIPVDGDVTCVET